MNISSKNLSPTNVLVEKEKMVVDGMAGGV
jgi:hypothetical protein